VAAPRAMLLFWLSCFSVRCAVRRSDLRRGQGCCFRAGWFSVSCAARRA
ncbi:hypothetical protein A2U01_0105536, partial [Trifolium medium]|nr:hypothetical protein [Trifolium medium]